MCAHPLRVNTFPGSWHPPLAPLEDFTPSGTTRPPHNNKPPQPTMDNNYQPVQPFSSMKQIEEPDSSITKHNRSHPTWELSTCTTPVDDHTHNPTRSSRAHTTFRVHDRQCHMQLAPPSDVPRANYSSSREPDEFSRAHCCAGRGPCEEARNIPEQLPTASTSWRITHPPRKPLAEMTE